MGLLKTTRNMIGNLFGAKLQTGQAQSKDSTVSQPLTVQADVLSQTTHPARLEDMTADVLRARRQAMLAHVRVGQSRHTKFFNILNTIWVMVSPLLFVLLTVGEVAYVLYQVRMQQDQWVLVNPLVLIVAGAFFVDLSMMFTTWRLASLREKQLAYQGTNEAPPLSLRRDIAGLTVLWWVFAVINVICQVAFLVRFIDTHNYWLIGVVVMRVVGFIASDYTVAFYLSRTEPEYREVVRGMRELMEAEDEFTRMDEERMRRSAENDAKIEMVLIDVQQKKADADFLAELRKEQYRGILDQQRQRQLSEGHDQRNDPTP